MWERIRSIWTLPDIRNKLLFTLGMLLFFRVLSNIPVPLTSEQQQRLLQLFSNHGDKALGQLLSFLDAFSGGSLQNFSIVAMSVYPYITASIVMQLLAQIVPAWQKMQTEGESGRQRLSRITRVITVPLAFLEAIGQTAIFQRERILDPGTFNLSGPNWLNTLTILMTLTASTMLLVWVGELITEYGVGNGTSLIIFAGIVSTLPNAVWQDYIKITTSPNNGGAIVNLAVTWLLGIVMILGLVYLYLGQRRIPVHYPTKRQVGRQMLIGSAKTTYIPMQVNSTGMIPLIFASSILLFPSILAQYLIGSPFKWLSDIALWVSTYLANTTQWYYWLLEFLLVVAFTYFYAYVGWQQQNISETLQKQGAVVPGWRPGETTSKHLLAILNHITLAGALSLGIAVILPLAVPAGNLNSVKLLIVVGVVLDTVRQFEAHMVMRNYSGFLS